MRYMKVLYLFLGLAVLLGIVAVLLGIIEVFPTASKPRIHALLVIMGNDPTNFQQYQANERYVKNLLTRVKNKNVCELTLTTLNTASEDTTRKPSREAIFKWINKLTPGRNDVVFIYYCGHGGRVEGEPGGGTYFDLVGENLFREEVVSALKSSQAWACRLKMMVTDTCAVRSRNIETPEFSIGTSAAASYKAERAYTQLFVQHEGFLHLTSATEDEYSWGDSTNGGWFTNALVASINSHADAAERFVGWNEIFTATKKRVKSFIDKNADRVAEKVQHPKHYGEFPRPLRSASALARWTNTTDSDGPTPGALNSGDGPTQGQRMVLIPGGTFQMGSNNGDANEKPVRSVYVAEFYMERAPNVTHSYTLKLPTTQSATTGRYGEVIRFLRFSPDGRMLAAGVGNDRNCTIMLWDPHNGRLIRTFKHDEAIAAMRFSPDGRMLASANERIIVLWDPQTGRQIRTLIGHEDEISDLSFSPDGLILASTDYDGTIMLWDPQTGRRIRSLRHQNDDDPVYSVSFSPDGQMLASGDIDGGIVLWDPQTGSQIRTFKDEGRIVDLGFSRDGRILAGSMEKGFGEDIVSLWDPRTGRRIRTFDDPEDSVYFGGFSPDGQMLAIPTSDDRIILWDPDNGRRIRTFEVSHDRNGAVSFSPDGKVLAAADDSGESIVLWDLDNGKRINVITDEKYDVSDVSFSPDGQMLATGCEYGEIFLWNSQTHRQIRTLTGHEAAVAVSFSPDGRMLASGDDRGIIILWNTRNGRSIRTLNREEYIVDLRFSPNGQMLASSGDGVITLWNPRNGNRLRTIEIGNLSKAVMAFSPDSQMLAVDDDRNIVLWNPRNGNRLSSLAYTELPIDFAFSPDGQILVSLYMDNSVLLWDPHSGELIRTLPFKEDQKTYPGIINFSPDGQTLSIGRSFWDWDTRQYLGTAKGNWGERGSQTTFSSDGRTIAAGGGPKVELWLKE